MSGPEILYINATSIADDGTKFKIQPRPAVVYSDARTQAVVARSTDYRATIIRFQCTGLDLPVFIPTIEPGQSDPNLTTMALGFRIGVSNPGAASLSYSQCFEAQVRWAPETQGSSPPTLSPSRSGLQAMESDYYWARSIQHVTRRVLQPAINQAWCGLSNYIADTYPVPPVASVSSATAAAGVVTYTTSAAHSFTQGQRVTISGLTPSGYNVTNAIITGTPTATTFTIANATTGASTGTGTATAAWNLNLFDGTTFNPAQAYGSSWNVIPSIGYTDRLSITGNSFFEDPIYARERQGVGLPLSGASNQDIRFINRFSNTIWFEFMINDPLRALLGGFAYERRTDVLSVAPTLTTSTTLPFPTITDATYTNNGNNTIRIDVNAPGNPDSVTAYMVKPDGTSAGFFWPPEGLYTYPNLAKWIIDNIALNYQLNVNPPNGNPVVSMTTSANSTTVQFTYPFTFSDSGLIGYTAATLGTPPIFQMPAANISGIGYAPNNPPPGTLGTPTTTWTFTYPNSGGYNSSDCVNRLIKLGSPDYDTTDSWSPVDSLVFTSTMPIQPEVSSSTNMLNGTSVYIGSSTNSIIPSFTDISLPLEGGATDYLGKITYAPSAQYRWLEFVTNQALTGFNFQLLWRNRFTDQLARVFLKPSGSVQMKLMLQRKF